MKYRRMKDDIYIRLDKDDNVVSSILNVCHKEKIQGGYIQGIGACDKAVLSTYISEKKEFVDHTYTGMIEMVSLMGNISIDDAEVPILHSHAIFSYLSNNGKIEVTAGHLKDAHISCTGEIVLRTTEEKIKRMFDEKVGIEVWKLK